MGRRLHETAGRAAHRCAPCTAGITISWVARGVANIHTAATSSTEAIERMAMLVLRVVVMFPSCSDVMALTVGFRPPRPRLKEPHGLCAICSTSAPAAPVAEDFAGCVMAGNAGDAATGVRA